MLAEPVGQISPWFGWFRDGLQDDGTETGIPDRKMHSKPAKDNMRCYKPGNGVEVLFVRLND
jgi:hypothetical protein